jgi:quinol monooxygenase YgiN/mannose-6-phosphate isomerase-like protein (cupin superfamily)
MSQIARNAKMKARPGAGARAAELLLAAAEELRSDPGCELYLVSRQTDDPDTIWVTELWRSQADLDAAIEKIRGSDRVAEVKSLVAESEMIELDLLGGKGARPVVASDNGGPPPFTRLTLTEAEDLAAKHGFGDFQEARFPNQDLRTEQTGLGLIHLKPGKRAPFAHRHVRAEEVYVILSGSGRVNVEGEIVEVGPRDAIRVAPRATRAFEAGPDGLEVLAFGPRHPGDAQVIQDWWTD